LCGVTLFPQNQDKWPTFKFHMRQGILRTYRPILKTKHSYVACVC
jgi:hypothetical protein